MLNLDVRVTRNEQELKQLTHTVTELATMMKISEKRHEEERNDAKDTLSELRKLSDAVNSTRGLEKEFSALKSEVAKLGSDIKNLESAQQAIPTLRDKLNEAEKETQVQITELASIIQILTSDLNIIKDAKLKEDGVREGVGKVAVVFWTVFGGVLTTGFIGGFLLIMRLYFGIEVGAEVISMEGIGG